MAQRETLGKPEERPEETQWLPDGAAPPETAQAAEPLESGDTSSWLASEVLEQAYEARPAEPDPDEEWDDVPGLPPRRDRIRPAPSDGDAEVEAAPSAKAAPAAAPDSGTPAELEVDVHGLQAEVGEIRARLDAAAKKTAERRRRSARESEQLAAGVRKEIADARDRFEALMSERDALKKAQETFDRRTRKVLGAFAKRLERVEAGISTLTAGAESTHELLSVLSQRRGAAAEPEPRSSRLDLNAATFEDLRNLGFSATQATRVLSYRDAHGLDSVERLRDIPGLPGKLFESVKPSLTV